MDIVYFLEHPEELNHETLYDLRKLVALQPTFHAARILMLQNLFLLHDPTFDQELRRAALLLPDRRVLFEMTQARHDEEAARQTAMAYVPTTPLDGRREETGDDQTVEVTASANTTAPAEKTEAPATSRRPRKKYATPQDDTTARLLNDFLDTTPTPLQKRHIKPNPATDYMAYLMENDGENETQGNTPSTPKTTAQNDDSRLYSLIDNFIQASEEGIKLPTDPSQPEGILDDPDEQELPMPPHNGVDAESTMKDLADELAATEDDFTTEVEDDMTDDVDNDAESPDEDTAMPAVKPLEPKGGDLTEALAYAYIKQQKYERAAEVLAKLQAKGAALHNPYLADQVRFLQKLALNERHKTKG